MSVDHSLLGLATCKVLFKNTTTTKRQLHLEIFLTCVYLYFTKNYLATGCVFISWDT